MQSHAALDVIAVHHCKNCLEEFDEAVSPYRVDPPSNVEEWNRAFPSTSQKAAQSQQESVAALRHCGAITLRSASKKDRQKTLALITIINVLA